PLRRCGRQLAPSRSCSRSSPIRSARASSTVWRGLAATSPALAGSISALARGLELLKEIAPNVTRAAIVRDPAIIAGIGQWGAIQSASPSVAIEVSPVNIDDAGEIERSIAAFARSPNGGLILTGSPLTILRRDLIIALAARHKLPAIYY